MARLNLLQLALSFHPGGRRNAIASLVRGLRGAPDRCDLCCLDELGCKPEELEGVFDSVNILGRAGSTHYCVVQRLHRLCHERDITLIHTHDAASQYFAALVRLLRPQTKVIMTFHRSLGFESARWRDRLRNAFACWRSAAVITASEERRNHFRAENYVSARKLQVIPLGLDVESLRPDQRSRAEVRKRLGVRDETVVVGAVGHFGPEKGIDVAIAAFQAASQRAPEVDSTLVVLGNGTPEQRAALDRMVTQASPDKIVLAGYQKNVRDWYSAFDVFLHTPRLEAFGLVLIEAMAAGLPVVAADVGGVPEIVRHERTGLLCPPESPAALADALARLLCDPDLRKRFAVAASDVAVSEYSASLCARRYLDLYQRVLRGWPVRGDAILR